MANLKISLLRLPGTGFIRSLGHYLFYGNIFIALCAFCLFWETCLLQGFPLPTELGLFVFFATWLLYNFDSLLPSKTQQQASFSRRRAWVQQHRPQLLSAILVAGVSAFYLFIRTYQNYYLLFVGHLALLSVLYSLPVLSVRGRLLPLRNIPRIKVFLVSYVWTCVTVGLPLLAHNERFFSMASGLLLLQRFFFLLPITIIFDIRDVARDKATGTLTLPGTIGVKQAKTISWVSLGLFAVLVGFIQNEQQQVALWFSALATGWVVGQSSENKNEYFFAVVADGMMVLQFLLLYF